MTRDLFRGGYFWIPVNYHVIDHWINFPFGLGVSLAGCSQMTGERFSLRVVLSGVNQLTRCLFSMISYSSFAFSSRWNIILVTITTEMTFQLRVRYMFTTPPRAKTQGRLHGHSTKFCKRSNLPSSTKSYLKKQECTDFKIYRVIIENKPYNMSNEYYKPQNV